MVAALQQYLIATTPALLAAIYDGCYVGSNIKWLICWEQYVMFVILAAICNVCYVGSNM